MQFSGKWYSPPVLVPFLIQLVKGHDGIIDGDYIYEILYIKKIKYIYVVAIMKYEYLRRRF